MRLRVFQVACTLLVILALLHMAQSVSGFGYFRDLASGDRRSELALWIPAFLASGLACGAALALAWRAAARADARAIALFLVFLSLFWSSLLSVILIGADPTFAGWLTRWWTGAGWVFVLLPLFLTSWLLPASFLRVAACFPRQLEPGDPAVGWLTGRLLSARFVWGVAIAAPVIWFVSLERASVWTSADGTLAVLVAGMAVTMIAVPIAVLAGARLFRIGYRGASHEARNRARWLVAGFVASGYAVLAGPVVSVLAIPLGENPVLTAVGDGIFGTAPLFAVLGILAGTFFSGSLGSELVVRKTTVYGAFMVFLMIGFAGLEATVSVFLAEYLEAAGRVGAWTTSAVAGIVAALCMRPVQRLAARPSRNPEGG